MSASVISPEFSPDNIPSFHHLRWNSTSPTCEANLGIALAFVPQHVTLTLAFNNESQQKLRGLIECVDKKAGLWALSGEQWRVGWTEKGPHCCKETQSVVAPWCRYSDE